MFDHLVETRKERNERSAPVLIATAAVYAATLLIAATVAIFCFNPQLSEASPKVIGDTFFPAVITLHSNGPAGSSGGGRSNTGASTRAVPKTLSTTIRELPTGSRRAAGLNLGVGISGTNGGSLLGAGEGMDMSMPTPPPPPRKPEPVPPPPPAPSPAAPRRVSEGVLQGNVLQRVQPRYPVVAQQARVSGDVVVQVTISEDGRVIDAVVLSGPILLQSAAVEAARQWTFAPTMLSRVPVRVQGILTFRFTLQ